MKASHQQASYFKRPAVLIATLGTEPQVVTAVLKLLLDKREDINDVHVLHTVAPGTPIARAVETLQQAFSSAPFAGRITLHLNPILDQSGQAIKDVETPAATQAAFRQIYNQVRVAKRAGSRVHLSIAGGRKTMSVFGMVTAQLLFDDHDHLWHLFSSGDFLESKRLHPKRGDQVSLIPIPVVGWSSVAPMLLDLAEIEDPFAALQRQQELRLNERLEAERAFVYGSLTPAEERAVFLLVREGLSDNEIAERLTLSPRTVEQHLRSAYTKAANHWDLPDVNRTVLVTLLNLYYSTQITGNPA